HEERAPRLERERRIDDGVRLEVGDDPPEAARPRQRPEVGPGEAPERVALHDRVAPRVRELAVAVGLALAQEEPARLVAGAEGEAVPGAGRGRHGQTSSRSASEVTRTSRISSKDTLAA